MESKIVESIPQILIAFGVIVLIGCVVVLAICMISYIIVEENSHGKKKKHLYRENQDNENS